MIEQRVEIVNRLGLHARAAAKLVQAASAFVSGVQLLHNGSSVDAKSMLGILLLAAAQGTVLTVQCQGEDQAEALETISKLIADRFGEAE